MNYNLLFYVLSEFSKKNLITEIIGIKKFYNQKPIKESKIKKKIKIRKIPYVLLPLENNKKILFKDKAINFYLSFGFLLGEDTRLSEVKLKNESSCVIMEDKYLEEFSLDIEEVISTISPKELYLKKINNPHSATPFLNQIRSYISSQKKLNFTKIHIIKGEGLELFNPTCKFRHFKLAKIMNIPLLSLIEDNFIIETNINIYDYNNLLSNLEPFKLKEEEIEIETYNSKEIYRDISLEYFVKIDKENILNKLGLISKSNIDINNISSNLYGFTGIEISQNYKGNVLPLFKEKSTRKYYPISSTEEFFELTGVYFKNDIEVLKRIIIVNQQGEELFYKGKYLNEKLEKIFNQDYFFENIIKFENLTELIIKLMIVENPKELIKIENIDINQKIIFEKNFKKLIFNLKKISIETVKIPKYQIPISFEEKLFSTICFEYNLIKENFLNNLVGFKKSVILINEKTFQLNFLLNKVKFDDKQLPHIYQIINILNFFLKRFNYDLFTEMKKEFEELFKIKKIIYNFQNFSDYDNILKDLIFIWKVSKKKELEILLKKEFNLKLLPELKEIEKEYKFEKIIKPNLKKIKNNFQYNRNKILLQINSNNFEIGNVIEINEKKIQLSKEYFLEYKNYKEKKLLINNSFFKIFQDK